MSKRLPTVWEADAHTIAKIEILQSYLHAWFPILGRGTSRPILYVDGFSGPGRYTNHNFGSPIAALEAFEFSINSIGDQLKTRSITCGFIEADKKRFSVLAETLEERHTPRISTRRVNSTFVEGIAQLEREFPNNLTGDDPLFVFADPFGGTDTPLKTFEAFMKGKRSELLLNLDADGIARIYEGKNNHWDKQLDDMFGGRCWEKELGSSGESIAHKASKILHLYKNRLREAIGVKYVFEFEMRGKRDSLNYYLVFATNHPMGMERMKEAMSKVDQNGRYCFSDADQGQVFLFSDESTRDYAAEVHEHFLGQEVPFEEVEIYCLCETPAKSTGTLLKTLENQNQIEVFPEDGKKRRKGSFKREVISKIRFTRSLIQVSLF